MSKKSVANRDGGYPRRNRNPEDPIAPITQQGRQASNLGLNSVSSKNKKTFDVYGDAVVYATKIFETVR